MQNSTNYSLGNGGVLIELNNTWIQEIIQEKDIALARNRELIEENNRLTQLVKDICHAHFKHGENLGYEEWINLLAATRTDMEEIYAGQEGPKHEN